MMVEANQYHEKIMRFGPDDSLVGIVSKPQTDRLTIPLAVIFLNAGLLHRVGIQRMHVDLARDLAQMGVTSFRVDLYGIGESISQSGDKTFRQRAFVDISEAMTFLSSKFGIRSFILIGHCAGADNAFPVLVCHDNVVGAVLIDGFGYPTIGFKFRDLGGPSMANPFKWAKFFIKLMLKLITGNASEFNFMELYGRNWPKQNDAEKNLKKVFKRGAKLFFIYTGGVSLYYNHGSQFIKMFPSLANEKGLTLKYLENADHNLTQISFREDISEAIIYWVKTNFVYNSKAIA